MMRRLGLRLALLAGLSVLPGVADADEMVADLNSTEWGCGEVVRFPPKEAAEVLKASEIEGVPAKPGSRAFLLLRMPDVEDGMFGGTFLAIKGERGWETYGVESGGAFYAAKASADGRRAVSVSMIAREGPGPGYTIVSTDDGFATFHCAAVESPDTLNKPTWRNEYLALDDLNGSDDGKIVLAGHAVRDREAGERTEYYRYTSMDGGRTWGAPEKLDKAAGPLPGIFSQVGREGIDALVEDYRRSFGP